VKCCKNIYLMFCSGQQKKLQVGFTCCRGTHNIKDSTHTVRYYPPEDSILQ
jgi:hypothetical protein